MPERMLPSHQRFHAGQGSGREIQLGLIVEYQFRARPKPCSRPMRAAACAAISSV